MAVDQMSRAHPSRRWSSSVAVAALNDVHLTPQSRWRQWSQLAAAILVLGGVCVLASVTPTAQATVASSGPQECEVGTGAPLPPTLANSSTSSCRSPSLSNLATGPLTVPLEAGAQPAVQTPVTTPLPAGLATGETRPLTPGSRENLYWYSLYASHQNCWESGFPGESAHTCDTVGAAYLASGNYNEGAISTDVALSVGGHSGDFCNDYNLAENFNATDANTESGYTGYEPPSPLTSYQIDNHHRSVCQANETWWGHEVRGVLSKESINNECKTPYAPCGMQHYVALGKQELNDRPWSSAFGAPTLVVSLESNPYTDEVKTGSWGYICPLFQDSTHPQNILEYCFEQWTTGSGFPNIAHPDVVAACQPADNHNVDQTITTFDPGTVFATELTGSTNTFSFTGSNYGWRHFIAGITEADLRAAIKMDNEQFKGTNGHPEPGYGCGRSSSTEPKNWALVGTEQGVEGGGLNELGASEGNLQLWTEYTPLAPTVKTNSMTNPGQTQLTLNGSVNPNGYDTHYHFQYGPTMAYGWTTPEIDAGGSSSEIAAKSTIYGLQAGTPYHYRLVASNAVGTTYGSDQTATTTEAYTENFSPSSGGAVWHDYQTPSEGNGWGGWSSLGKPTGVSFTSNVGTNSSANNVHELFVLGSNEMWANYQTPGVGNGWYGWYSLGKPTSANLIGNIAINTTSYGINELFVRGSDGNLWASYQTPGEGNGWHSWYSLGKPSGVTFASEMATNTTSYGINELFAVGSDGNVWASYQTPGEGNGWHSWYSLGKPGTATPAGNLTTNTSTTGINELFVRGSDGNVWANYQTPGEGNGWYGWYSLSKPEKATLTGTIGTGDSSSGINELFAVGSDGNVYANYQTPGERNGWYGWYSLGKPASTTLVSDVTVGASASRLSELFARGNDGAMWANYQTPGVGNGWYGWYSLGALKEESLSGDITPYYKAP
jgi:hypothetical protein